MMETTPSNSSMPLWETAVTVPKLVSAGSILPYAVSPGRRAAPARLAGNRPLRPEPVTEPVTALMRPGSGPDPPRRNVTSI